MFKPDEQISKTIKRYLKKDGRVGFQLRELNELFVKGVHLKTYRKVLLHHHSLREVFKILVLVHRLAIASTQPTEDLLLILDEVCFTRKDQFSAMLVVKLLEPYRLYLQRRVLIHSGDLEGGRKTDREGRVYQLLNLLHLGTSFSDIIYTFGRYYMDSFACVVDFNIILGADLQGLYQEMVEKVLKPASREILQEFEAVHEKMYVVFYNCYFHRYLKNYIPKWVITDLLVTRGRYSTPRKDARQGETEGKGRSLSSVTTKTGSSGQGKEVEVSMEESCLFLNQKAVEEVEEGDLDRPIEPQVYVSCFQIEASQESSKVRPRQMPKSCKKIELRAQQEQLLNSMVRVMASFQQI